jgi:isoprenylcysteine carboxyl methyltransferase (ICMT) family protein YpbQ
VFGSWWTALLFSAANGVMLSVRISAEERALGVSWQRSFRDRRRFHPADPSS